MNLYPEVLLGIILLLLIFLIPVGVMAIGTLFIYSQQEPKAWIEGRLSNSVLYKIVLLGREKPALANGYIVASTMILGYILFAI